MIVLLVLAVFILGGFVVGGVVYDVGPVAAQLGDGDDDGDDANEGPDVAITGPALEAASEAALEYIGEGRVTDTEVGDEEGFYEVEITREDGSEVDVHLDENFNVLGHEDE